MPYELTESYQISVEKNNEDNLLVVGLQLHHTLLSDGSTLYVGNVCGSGASGL